MSHFLGVCYSIMDIQAHGASHCAALHACTSAISENTVLERSRRHLLSFLFYFSFVPSTDLLSNMKEAAILSPLLVCRRGVQAVCQKYLIYAGKNNFSFALIFLLCFELFLSGVQERGGRC